MELGLRGSKSPRRWRGGPAPTPRPHISCVGRWDLYHLATWEAPCGLWASPSPHPSFPRSRGPHLSTAVARARQSRFPSTAGPVPGDHPLPWRKAPGQASSALVRKMTQGSIAVEPFCELTPSASTWPGRPSIFTSVPVNPQERSAGPRSRTHSCIPHTHTTPKPWLYATHTHHTLSTSCILHTHPEHQLYATHTPHTPSTSCILHTHTLSTSCMPHTHPHTPSTGCMTLVSHTHTHTSTGCMTLVSHTHTQAPAV